MEIESSDSAGSGTFDVQADWLDRVNPPKFMSKPKKKVSADVFEIVFKKNGQTVKDLEPPPIRDVALSQESVDLINEAIKEAEKLPKKIQNEADKTRYLEQAQTLRGIKKELEAFQNHRRALWTDVAGMIHTACANSLTRLIALIGKLTKDIADWEQMVREGIERQRQELERKAAEKEQEAKYTDNPEKKRRASREAEVLAEEAKKYTPEKHTTPSTAFSVHWEPEINDLIAVLRKYPEFVEVSLNYRVIQKAIKELQEQGVEITPHTFAPGLHLRKESRVTFR